MFCRESGTNDVINAINHEDEYSVSFVRGKQSQVLAVQQIINIDADQVNKFIDGVRNVHPKVLGFALTFLHEIDHTTFGRNLPDCPTFPCTSGPVEKVNKIREEMGLDTRRSYNSASFNWEPNVRYIPFDQGSIINILHRGKPPSGDSKYIIIKD